MKHPKDKTINMQQMSNVVRLTESTVDIEIEKISSVQEKKINWLWKDKLAFGKITLFAGEPGVGKSQLLLYIASIVSKGEKFHFESQACEPQNVLIISGEDSADDTIKPRLMALNADLDRVHFVKGIKRIDKSGHPYFDAICLIEHLAELEIKIKENNYKFIIVDPIALYLGSVDENKNKEIRAALGQLTALAERHGVSLILNSHFSKPGTSNKNAINRVMGSIGFAAAARMVFGIMKDPENPDRRLFLTIKNNIGQDKEGLAYNIKSVLLNGGIETSRVEWLNERVSQTANEILNTDNADSPKVGEAKEFLEELLKNGSVSLTEIRSQAEQKGISVSRLYKAKEVLKIYENISIGSKRGKIWSLS